jgi:Protein of unknown function (DUF1648)
MNNRSWWKLSVVLLWLALPLIALRYWLVWDRLPARMATHFNAANQPNGWMSREASLMFTLGLFVFLPTLFTVIITRIRKPDTAAWSVLAMFYVILGVIYRISDSVLEYNLTGQPLPLVPVIVTLFAAIFMVVIVSFSSKRGQSLPAGTVLAEEVHPGRLWALVLFLPAVVELAVIVAIPDPGLRLALGLVALVMLLAGSMAWSGFNYVFTSAGVEVRTLGFRLRSIPLDQIKEYSAAPWSLAGGYGVRGFGERRAYVWGNRGVRIKTSDGEVFLGHSHPERIVHDLDAIKQFAH